MSNSLGLPPKVFETLERIARDFNSAGLPADAEKLYWTAKGVNMDKWADLKSLEFDNRNRFERAIDAVEGFLLERVFWWWYELFYLLACVLITPVKAGYTAVKDVWSNEEC